MHYTNFCKVIDCPWTRLQLYYKIDYVGINTIFKNIEENGDTV